MTQPRPVVRVSLGQRRAGPRCFLPFDRRQRIRSLGVIRFQHRRKISSILIRNTVVPIAIRTTLGSCLAIRQITENPELL